MISRYMKNILLLLAIILTTNYSSYGQVEIGLQLNIGASQVKNVSISSSSPNAGSTPLSLAGEFGSYFNFTLNKRLFDKEIYIGTGLSISQINGRYKTKTNGMNNELYPTEFKYYLTYLNTPIMIGMVNKKMNFSMGLKCAALIFNTRIQTIKGTRFDGTPVDYKDKTHKTGFDWFDYGFQLNIGYELTEKISIGAIYYHGLNDITGKGISSKWKTKQIGIKLQYVLSNN